VEATEGDSVEVLAKSDGPARKLVADGGVAEGFRIGIARAADSEAIDSFDQIDDAVRKIEELDGPANRRAKLLVSETDGAGVKLVDELDSTDLRTLFESVDSRETLARLSRQFEEGTVESRHLDEITNLLDSGDMDGADLGRFSRIIASEGNGPDIEGDLTTDDILTVAERGELSDTLLVVSDGEGRIRWLEFNEGEPVGFDKILSKHESEIYRQYSSINSQEDIKQLIKEAIKNSDSDDVIVKLNPDGGKRYYLNVEEGSYPLRVATSENGFILSAHPDRDAKGMFD